MMLTVRLQHRLQRLQRVQPLVVSTDAELQSRSPDAAQRDPWLLARI